MDLFNNNLITNNKIMTYKELIEYIKETENDDLNCERLEKAFLNYCSTYEKCEAFKNALINEIKDQFENENTDTEQDLRELKDIIDGAI